MANRITGANSGIDVDSVVKQSLSTQQNKIDKAYQQQKVYEYQQEQLKKIVDEAQSFYDKYLDVTSSKNLLLTSAYQTATFTSSSTAVTAKGFAGADVGSYSMVVNQMATSAKTTLKADDFSEILTSKAGVIAVKMKNSSGKEIVAYTDVSMTSGGEIDMATTAKNLTNALNKAGINVSAKYSEFTKGITLESGELGEDIEFQAIVNENVSATDLAAVDLKQGLTSEGIVQKKVELLGGNSAFSIEAKGKNAEGTITKNGHIYRFNQKSNVVNVDNVQFTINSVPPSSSDNNITPVEHLQGGTGETVVLYKGDLVTTKIGNNVISTSKSYNDGIIVTKGTSLNTVKGDLVALTKDGAGVIEEGSSTERKIVLSKKEGQITTTTTIEKDENGNVIRTTTTKTYDDDTEVKTVVENGKPTTTASKIGFTDIVDNSTDTSIKKVITSSDGKTQTVIENGETVTTQLQDDGSEIVAVTKEDNSNNKITTTTKSEAIILTGKTEVTDLKDTIVKFVNDYNSLMQSINDKLWETRDTDYMPLTEDQKSEMTDSQIESWEKKAQTGLLRNDTDLKRIQSAMKSAMSSLMSGTGLSLESVGIKPVDNYSTKNGTFTIDEAKLTKALQENGENVKDLFTRPSTKGIDETTGKEKVSDKGGVLVQLQSILRSEFKSSSSALSKKIGFSGTSTENSNTLSKNITNKKKLISELKDKYSTKETALYKKYSSLEVMLEKLNAQTNSLYSMLGLN